MANNINLYQTEAAYQAAMANGDYVKHWVSLSKDTNTLHYDVPNVVNLGLPSGTLWADANIGALLPEQFGDYYAWGEIEPYYNSQDPLTWKDGKSAGYAWTSYKYGTSSSNLTKYNSTDELTQLELSDDAAYNLETRWCIPTYEQWDELRTECTWTWTTLNGVKGYNVEGPNHNNIFLPATGYRNGTSLSYTGAYGNYWSSTLPTDNQVCAWLLFFGSSLVRLNSNYYRYQGLSVRPVIRK